MSAGPWFLARCEACGLIEAYPHQGGELPGQAVETCICCEAGQMRIIGDCMGLRTGDDVGRAILWCQVNKNRP